MPPLTLRDRGLGFVDDDPRHDLHDKYALKFAGAAWQASAVSKNRDVYLAVTRDQEQCNGCVGFSARLAQQIAEAMARKADGMDPRDTPELSPFFAWYNSRGDADKTLNVGAQIREADTMAKRYGVCLDGAWPFEEVEGDYKRRLAIKPPAAAYEQAARHQLLDAYRIPDGDVGGIQASLLAGHPVQFGFPVYDSFFDTPTDTGLVRYPWAGPFAGLHAVTAQDCDVVMAKDGAWIQNSWSNHFGKMGWCFFPVAALATAKDIWAYTQSERLD